MVLMLGGLAAATAIGVVAFNNPVRSAICLVLNFFTLAFLYFTLGAEMMGITQIVVYTGAIMVLFLFVIMLLNLSSDNVMANKKDMKPVMGVVLGLGLFGLLASQILSPLLSIVNPIAPDRDASNPIGWGQPQALAKALFTQYVWPLEVISLLLLLGVVGAILLARRRLPA